MTIDQLTSLFFDATCLFAAAQSPTGGSARVLRLCNLGWFVGWVSQLVVVEAESAIRRKATTATLTTLERLLRHPALRYAPVMASPAARYSSVNAKDAHVLAAAHACGARYLITLDKPFAGEVNATGGELVAIAPGDFLQRILPTHPDFQSDPAAGQRDGDGITPS